MGVAERIKKIFSQEQEQKRKFAKCESDPVKGDRVFSKRDLFKMKQMRTVGVFSLCLIKSHIKLHEEHEALCQRYLALKESCSHPEEK